MANLRNGSPFFRVAKGNWYCWIDGKQTSLRVRGERSEREAIRQWRLRIASPTQTPIPTPTQTPIQTPTQTPIQTPAFTLAAMVDAFLTDAQSRLKSSTVTRYSNDLRVLVRSLGEADATSITHQQLTIWLCQSLGSSTTKAIRIRSVGACFGWAVRQDLLEKNPVIKVVKPKSRSRTTEACISDDDHAQLLEAATPCFRIVLQILYATGCRPSEACAITCENFDAANAVVVLAVHKSDATGKPRLIFLPDAICEILKALAAQFGKGHLLRSRQGHAWTAKAVTYAMMRLRRKLKITAIAYGYRHSFATRALSSGVADATVAALLGHSSTAMLHKHYSHLTSQADVLRAALGSFQ